ncbi:MAG: ribonuclease HI [Muribaculaceae bacterium]|nr:ribonuclease HI [Muribaculaceae bacterium]
MIEIVIHQSSGNAGWYIKQADGSIVREGFVLGDNPNAYTTVTYQAAIDALDGVPMSESVVFSSPQSNTLARKRKQKDQTSAYVDFQRCIAGRLIKFNSIDADCERANLAKMIARKATMCENNEVDKFIPDFIAYTDGSCNNLSPYGEGGAAYVILDGQRNIVKQNSKGFVGVTNNRMELMAILSAVAAVPAGSSLVIYTDSQYCIQVLTNKKNADNYTRPNANIIRQYFNYASRLKDIRFEWVKGHNGDEFNEMVDALAQSRTEEMRTIHNIPLYDYRNSPKCRKR